MTGTRRLGLPVALAAACSGNERAELAPAPDPPATVDNTTVNEFFARGAPTFVLGTAGDELADRRIAVQVGLLRGLALPRSTAVADTAVAAGWPAHPILYGTTASNAVLAELAPELPYQLGPERLVIGGEVFEGEGHRLVAMTPAGARHPAFVVFGGTGAAGIAEINAGLSPAAPILVADAFGPLVQGTWKRDGDRIVAALGPRQRRIGYRTVTRELASADGSRTAAVRVGFPAMLAPAADEAAVVDAIMAGLATAVGKLAIAEPVPVSVYVYPDRASKAQLTGNPGDGHAVPSSRALHVRAAAPAALESLVAHEGTHVLGYFAWGPAGTPLLGEGMAVWVAGRYQGKPIEAWKREAAPAPLAELVGPGWMRLPEQAKYPLAALVFEAALAQVGAAAVRDHLVSATPDTWAAACAAAGTSPERLDAALQAALAR